MAYQFHVEKNLCINCGICMDQCPVHCLDMTRPTGEGELASQDELLSPIPGKQADREWMMLSPIQVAPCIGCQVCAQECPTNAIAIESAVPAVTYARRGPISPLPAEEGWQTLTAYTRAVEQEHDNTLWADGHTWRVAERRATWQSWRSWLGERKEDLRAPCQAACPVGTNAGLYVSLIAEGRYDEAFQVAAEVNPFPSICGRVCTAPCEAACRRNEFDEPIAIRDLKRFASDHRAPERRTITPAKVRRTERVAIVGAGPTGLSAAYYLARRGYQVKVFDAMPVAGGMMGIGIPEHRLPRTELDRDIDAIRDLGVDIVLNTAIGRDLSLAALQDEYDAVLLAVGAQRSQRLDVPGETDLHGVVPAIQFLKQFNLDPGTRLSGKVAVVGGGSTAMDAARSALRAGADEVFILYRRTRADMPAQTEEVREALAEGIQLHELVIPVEILGTEERTVQGMRCQQMRQGEPDKRGRRQVTPIAGTDFVLAVDTVLVAIGEAPDPSFLPPDCSVQIAAWGGLLIHQETLATGAPGIFAAGDVTSGPTSVIAAAAHGRKAARAIHAYLRKLPVWEVNELPNDIGETASTLPTDGPITLDLRPSPRAIMPLQTEASIRERTIECANGFSEEQARREARRCLRCDLAYLCPSIRTTTVEV